MRSTKLRTISIIFAPLFLGACQVQPEQNSEVTASSAAQTAAHYEYIGVQDGNMSFCVDERFHDQIEYCSDAAQFGQSQTYSITCVLTEGAEEYTVSQELDSAVEHIFGHGTPKSADQRRVRAMPSTLTQMRVVDLWHLPEEYFGRKVVTIQAFEGVVEITGSCQDPGYFYDDGL